MAEFKFYLNRQGVRGPQGPQGEKGFSPDISVEKDTLSEYILRITNEGGYFLTTNLREHKEDRGGTYIRYDRDTGVMYAGDANPASTDTLGVIRIAKDDDFVGKAEDAAVTPAQIQDYLDKEYISKSADGTISGNIKFTGGSVSFTNNLFTNTLQTDNGPALQINEETRDVTFPANVIFNNVPKVGATPLVLQNDLNTVKVTADSAKTTADKNKVKIDALERDAVLVLGDQSISGIKTFVSTPEFNADIQLNKYNSRILFPMGGRASAYIGGEKDYGGIEIYGRETSSDSFAKRATITKGFARFYGALYCNNGDLVLSRENVTAGDNITITKTTDGIKISSTGGGGAGDVTLAGDNSFTGNNTFNGETTFNAHTWTLEQEAVTLNVTNNATLKNAYITGTLSSLGEISAVSIQAAGIKNNQNNKYYLNQASITAGSDNLVITETETGIKLVVNAPTDAQLAQLQELIADLSTKIDNLTNRVRALEEQIDGGVA